MPSELLWLLGFAFCEEQSSVHASLEPNTEKPLLCAEAYRADALCYAASGSARLGHRDCDVWGPSMNVLASDLRSFCRDGLRGTKGKLPDFSLTSSKNYGLEKLKFAS